MDRIFNEEENPKQLLWYEYSHNHLKPWSHFETGCVFLSKDEWLMLVNWPSKGFKFTTHWQFEWMMNKN